ncbi:MAG: flagellar hook basal-body protein [Candidatus Competibacteraceae bacterium]|nr:flagellar hook basal-body protein [Candidatus Competibacteraceae bacterium]MCP5125184.1 flagellar hook basal-body protein [Gammaproteobacteria bacterium]
MAASSMYTGLSGLQAANTDLATTSHNIANAGTTGFKNGRTEFGDLVDSNATLGGGLGVKTQAVNQQFNQGGIMTTSNVLDLAITGNGFFEVRVPGAATSTYTRAGSFHLDAAGNVVNNIGQQLYSNGAAVTITATSTPPHISSIIIDKDGTITAKDAVGGVATITGSPLNLATFPNPQGLKAISDTQWEATPESGTVAFAAPGTGGNGNLMSGALETSNVDLTEQLVNMILAQRNFQANSKTITVNNTLTETITQIIR